MWHSARELLLTIAHSLAENILQRGLATQIVAFLTRRNKKQRENKKKKIQKIKTQKKKK